MLIDVGGDTDNGDGSDGDNDGGELAMVVILMIMVVTILNLHFSQIPQSREPVTMVVKMYGRWKMSSVANFLLMGKSLHVIALITRLAVGVVLLQ